mmetsp:Transcript_122002/g.211702  ORF Transcript_122002/g.211702 Transcript_122002/m.211702 type:complete len:171 (+) Transcript_122002:241-753(+)
MLIADCQYWSTLSRVGSCPRLGPGPGPGPGLSELFLAQTSYEVWAFSRSAPHGAVPHCLPKAAVSHHTLHITVQVADDNVAVVADLLCISRCIASPSSEGSGELSRVCTLRCSALKSSTGGGEPSPVHSAPHGADCQCASRRCGHVRGRGGSGYSALRVARSVLTTRGAL